MQAEQVFSCPAQPLGYVAPLILEYAAIVDKLDAIARSARQVALLRTDGRWPWPGSKI
jgi:hypothetical protein